MNIETKKSCRLLTSPNVVDFTLHIRQQHVSRATNFVAIDSDCKIIRECFLNHPTIKDLRFNDKSVARTHKIDKGFLCYSNHWSSNFQHLLVELVPKIVTYKDSILGKYDDVPMILPPLLQNNLVRDICDLLGVPKASIVNLKPNLEYKVGTLLYSDYRGARGHTGSGSANEYAFSCLKKVHNLVCSLPTASTASKNIYISRTDKKDPQTNNGQNGANRTLSNETDLLESLKSRDFHCLFMGSTSVKEKASLLGNAETIIVPFGAGVMNIIFAKNIKRLVILDSGLDNGPFFFTSLCNYIHPNCRCDFIPLMSKSASHVHSPFTIDPKLVIRSLSNDC